MKWKSSNFYINQRNPSHPLTHPPPTPKPSLPPPLGLILTPPQPFPTHPSLGHILTPPPHPILAIPLPNLSLPDLTPQPTPLHQSQPSPTAQPEPSPLQPWPRLISNPSPPNPNPNLPDLNPQSSPLHPPALPTSTQQSFHF